MTTLRVAYNRTTRIANVAPTGTAVPAGHTNIGSFDHPDPVYPGSLVIYHGVRDLLYHRSEANPANTAKFPDNITDMHNVNIQLGYVPTAGLVTSTNSVSLPAEGTGALEVRLLPLNSTKQTVLAEVEDEDIATVTVTKTADGIFEVELTGVAEGQTLVTITDGDGQFPIAVTVVVTEA